MTPIPDDVTPRGDRDEPRLSSNEEKVRGARRALLKQRTVLSIDKLLSRVNAGAAKRIREMEGEGDDPTT